MKVDFKNYIVIYLLMCLIKDLLSRRQTRANPQLIPILNYIVCCIFFLL